ncbi:hypothetical protein EP227_06575 [bacterium]|nr:MAG: hypothetical protein EP227_06575 [bacterium]
MAKKKKTKKPEKSKNTKNIIIATLAVAVIALGVSAYQLKSTGEKSSETITAEDENALRRGETRATLSPALFSDPFIAETYQMAKEVPHVLDSLYCYCYCDRDPFRHVSLLSCFVDKHAAG